MFGFYSIIATIKFSVKKKLFTTNPVFLKRLATHFEQITPVHYQAILHADK